MAIACAKGRGARQTVGTAAQAAVRRQVTCPGPAALERRTPHGRPQCPSSYAAAPRAGRQLTTRLTIAAATAELDAISGVAANPSGALAVAGAIASSAGGCLRAIHAAAAASSCAAGKGAKTARQLAHCSKPPRRALGAAAKASAWARNEHHPGGGLAGGVGFCVRELTMCGVAPVRGRSLLGSRLCILDHAARQGKQQARRALADEADCWPTNEVNQAS